MTKKTKKVKKLSLRNQIETLQNEVARLNSARVAAEKENFKIRQMMPKPFMWRTQDGQLISPTKMDEQHLRNAISYLQRRIVHLSGTSTYLSTLLPSYEALHYMMKEALERGYQI